MSSLKWVNEADSASERVNFSPVLSVYVDESVTTVSDRLHGGKLLAMNANSLTPCTPDRPARTHDSVVTVRQLREYGLAPALIAERCRPGGPWRQLLPQVMLLHPGPPSSEERVRAALLYAGRDPGAHGPVGGGREAMVTGLAALALHRFSCVPPLTGLPRIDVLVARQRRLRDAGDVSIHRVRELPRPQDVCGLPCAPVARALADAVAELDDLDTVRVLFAEALRGGHCDASAVLRELEAAGLLERPYVRRALDVLRAEDRAMAEQRLYTMVRGHGLPDPVWNVELDLPGGPPLGGVDAYWPEHAVAVAVAADPHADDDRTDDDLVWVARARQRERLETLGITVLYLTPAKLWSAVEQQAAVVRAALSGSAGRTPAAYVVVTPR